MTPMGSTSTLDLDEYVEPLIKKSIRSMIRSLHITTSKLEIHFSVYVLIFKLSHSHL
jgi:hypothetical protein